MLPLNSWIANSVKLNENGELLCDTWFDDVFDMEGDFGLVILDDEDLYLRKDGKLLNSSGDEVSR